MHAGLPLLLSLAAQVAPSDAVDLGADPPAAGPISGITVGSPVAGPLPPLFVDFVRTKSVPTREGQQERTVQLEGTLERRALGSDEGLTVVAYRLASARVEYEGTRYVYTAAMVKAPFLAFYGASGVLRRLEFSPAVTTPVREALHHLVAGLQVVLPEDEASTEEPGTFPNRWEASLSEPRHRNQVLFERAGDAPAGQERFQRRLLHKEKVRSGPSRRARYTVRSTSGYVGWSPQDSAVTTAVIEDVVDLHYRGSLGYRLTTRVSATPGPTGALALDVAMPTSLAAAKDLIEGREAQRLNYYRMSPDEIRRVRGLELAAVMDQFMATVDEEPSKAAQLLKDYVRLYPDQCPAVADYANRLEETQANLTRVGFVYSALAAAGHREAQQTLAHVLERGEFNALNKDRAARATLSLKRPELFMEPALWGYRESLDTTSQARRQHRELITNLYGALGGFEHGEPELTRAVVDRLVNEYQSVGEPVRASVLLPALGNTGDFETLWPVFEPLFTHQHPTVRRRAFLIFQKAHTPEAFQRFAARYEAEDTYSVRLGASAVVEVMPRIAARLEWALDQAPKTRDPVILGRLVRIIGDERKSSPRTYQTLVALLDEPIDDETRRLIYRYVTPGQQGGAK